MHIAFRRATKTDFEFGRTVHHLAYREVVERQYGPWNEGQQDAFFGTHWPDAGEEIVLADGQPCGYVRIVQQPDAIEIAELVIHPDWQNKGIGSAVLARVMRDATQRGVPVKLRTHHANRAQGLYRRRGFEEYDRTDTHVLMKWVGNRR